MYPAYGNIKFAVGDLIIDREYKEIGILAKKAKILKTLKVDETATMTHTTNYGWEIIWIKQKIGGGSIGPFTGLDRVLSEDCMRLSISAGIMEHFPAGSKTALDFELDTYLMRNKS